MLEAEEWVLALALVAGIREPMIAALLLPVEDSLIQVSCSALHSFN